MYKTHLSSQSIEYENTCMADLMVILKWLHKTLIESDWARVPCPKKLTRFWLWTVDLHRLYVFEVEYFPILRPKLRNIEPDVFKSAICVLGSIYNGGINGFFRAVFSFWRIEISYLFIQDLFNYRFTWIITMTAAWRWCFARSIIHWSISGIESMKMLSL